MHQLQAEILLIDDDRIHLSILKDRLKLLGFSNIITACGYNESVNMLDFKSPDLIIMDYYLDESKTCIDFVKENLLYRDIPIIVISTFFNEKVLDDLMQIIPLDYISKSGSDIELLKSIKLALSKSKNNLDSNKLKDYFFIKVGKSIKKINVSDIEMVEVDGKYLNLNIDKRIYIIRSALSDFSKRLPNNFIKVHQSYIVNLNYVESITAEDSSVQLKNCSAYFSRNYKKALLNSYFIS